MRICKDCQGAGGKFRRRKEIPIGKSIVKCKRCNGTGTNPPVAPVFIQLHGTTENYGKKVIVNISDFPPNATTAHVAAKLGLFPSIGQARKNGWTEPLEVGKIIKAKKGTMRIILQ
jgi:hypothetical protein